MPQTNINTSNPVALRYLMNETIFTIEEEVIESTDHVQGECQRFVFYGGNKRNYLFLTQEKKHEWMSASALEAFNKTLAALQLSADDVALLNISTLSGTLQGKDLVSAFQPKVMVLLGVLPQSVGLEISSSIVVSDCDGITVFCAGTFDEMLADKEKKRLFWTTIKTLLV